MAREIKAAEDFADDRHDDVVGQACDDLGERRADDHGDREVENVALRDECFEVCKHAYFPSNSETTVSVQNVKGRATVVDPTLD